MIEAGESGARDLGGRSGWRAWATCALAGLSSRWPARCPLSRWKGRAGRSFVVAAALVLAAPGTAVSWDQWTVPQDVPGSPSGHDVLATLDNSGVLTAIWASGATDPLSPVAAQRSPEGIWTTVGTAGELGGWPVAAEVGPDDVVNLVISRDDGIYLTRLSPGGSWTDPELVPGGRPRGKPRLDASGPEVVVAFGRRRTSPHQVVASVRSRAGIWAGPVTVSRPDREARSIQVDGTTDGATTFVWEQAGATAGHRRIWTRTRNPDGTWNPRTAVSGVRAFGPALSVAGSGFAAVGWERHRNVGAQPQVATRTVAGDWRVSTLGRPRAMSGMTVLAQPRGLAAASWTYGLTTFGEGEIWAALGRSGEWSSATKISPDAGRLSDGHEGPLLAASAAHDGPVPTNFHLLWTGATGGSANQSIVMASVGSGVRWGTTRVLSSAHATLNDIAAAIGPEHPGCALWSVFDPLTRYRLQFSCLVDAP